MGLFNKYPYTDFHEMNLDFILETINKLSVDMQNFIKYNEIKFHDPIAWDITTQYTSNTVVTNEGVAYLSKQPVPSGINIDNDLYWLPIGIFNVSIDTFRSNITVYNEIANNRASRSYNIGNIIWWHDNLYYVIDEIVTGDVLSSNNLSLTTVADELHREFTERNIAIENLNNSINEEISNRNEAIESAISTEVSDRNEAIESAINTEVSDRNEAIESAIESAIDDIDIEDLKNVNINLLLNGQILKYNSNTNKWENSNESGGGPSDLPIISEYWDNNKSYIKNDIVQYNNKIYQAIQDVVPSGTLPTDTTYWKEYNSLGDKVEELNLYSQKYKHGDVITNDDLFNTYNMFTYALSNGSFNLVFKTNKKLDDIESFTASLDNVTGNPFIYRVKTGAIFNSRNTGDVTVSKLNDDTIQVTISYIKDPSGANVTSEPFVILGAMIFNIVCD